MEDESCDSCVEWQAGTWTESSMSHWTDQSRDMGRFICGYLQKPAAD